MTGKATGLGDEARTRTVLRESTGRGTATVLVEANDRLQEIRSLLAIAVSPDVETRVAVASRPGAGG